MDLQGKFKRLIKRKASPIALRGSRHAPDGDVHQPDHDQQLPQSPSSYTPVTDTEAAAQDSRANIEADETLASVEQRASKADGQGKAAGYTQAHQTEHTLADALPHRPRTRSRSRSVDPDSLSAQPVLVVQHPTPEFEHAQHHFGLKDAHGQPDTSRRPEGSDRGGVYSHPHRISQDSTASVTPSAVSPLSLVTSHRQLLDNRVDSHAILGPLDKPTTTNRFSFASSSIPSSSDKPSPSDSANMLHRKIWVKRPGASPTLVSIREDDLVDDVRDMILKKYANSLGRSFDSPDVTLRIVSRVDTQRAQTERILGPEEEMCRTLDVFFPGGQRVEEALLIDIPVKENPRPSPAYHTYSALDDYRPRENGTDYFPQMPAAAMPPPPPPQANDPRLSTIHQGSSSQVPEHARSMSVLNTGQLPALPSPGAATRRLHREHRPKYGRQHTTSPTIMTHIAHPPNNLGTASNKPLNLAAPSHLSHRMSGRSRRDSTSSDLPNGPPPAPPLPTPPAPDPTSIAKAGNTPPTPGARDHSALKSARPRRSRKASPKEDLSTKGSALPSSLLDGSVPPINVLIVEDNIINLKLLEAFMKRLKVRWSTAMNGQIAVNKWRTGGFHLVLMDIQLPIMSGLEATKEIRRLERVNGIGVFSDPDTLLQRSRSINTEGGVDGAADGSSTVATSQDTDGDNDRLKREEGLFKSPVIIVALTASSLQSDRHEALAAGCNDFLTKPVSFVWLERKVKEWGCMQALIDFDGWRKWKDFSSNGTPAATAVVKASNTKSPTITGAALPSAADAAKAKANKAKRDKRLSVDAAGVGARMSVDESGAQTDGAV